jgi:NADH-quinone oxidoreductase subunit G
LIEKYTAFELVMIPTLTNTLGVSQICDLDENAGAYSIGYNTEADFVLSGLGNGDLDMPAINQQEGTLTSINKRVNPTNVAVGYGGYELNDLANALGLNAELTVAYTKQLPLAKGFKAEEFDSLPNHYENDGTEKRGYLLDTVAVTISGDENVAAFDESAAITENVLYLANPIRQFSDFTAKAHQSKEKAGFYAGKRYLESKGLSEGDRVRVTTQKGSLETEVVHDHFIDAEMGYLTTFDSNLKSEALFDGYRFTTASIERV